MGPVHAADEVPPADPCHQLVINFAEAMQAFTRTGTAAAARFSGLSTRLSRSEEYVPVMPAYERDHLVNLVRRVHATELEFLRRCGEHLQ